MTTQTERDVRFHDDAVDWFLRTHPGFAVHVAKRLVITARREEDQRERMVVGYHRGQPLAPNTLFVCIESVKGRTYRVVGWAWGTHPGWYKSQLPGLGIKWLLHDSQLNTKKSLQEARRVLERAA